MNIQGDQMEKINAAKLNSAAVIPTRKHPDDAGIDFYSSEEKVIPPHSFDVVGTGITVEIPRGFVGLMMPKSRNDHLIGAGVIDAGYQGEIRIKVANLTDKPLDIRPGQAVAQMLLVPIVTPVVAEVPPDRIHLQKSERGATGGILGTE